MITMMEDDRGIFEQPLGTLETNVPYCVIAGYFAIVASIFPIT
jgi:hypothetical protein